MCLLKKSFSCVFFKSAFVDFAPKATDQCWYDTECEVRSSSVCSDVVPLSFQASLNSSMDSLKAELNTALQCDREAEDEVKKLKVRGDTSKTKKSVYVLFILLRSCLSFLRNFMLTLSNVIIFSQWQCWLYCTDLGAHSRPEAAHWGPVQWPTPVSIPGREAAAGKAKDGGAQGVDSSGWAQSPAVCGNLPSAESFARDRGQAERTGPIHSAQGMLSLYELHTQWIQSIWKVLRAWWVSSGDD